MTLTPGSSSEAELLVQSGYEARRAGRLAEALGLYQKAAEVFEETSHRQRFAHTIRHVGDILRQLNRREEARSFYLQALAEYRSLPDTPPLDLGNALRSMALLQENAGEAEQAGASWAEVLLLYEQVGIRAGVEECGVHLARSRGNELAKGT